MKAYLGVLILMGLNPLPDMELYWSSDTFYNNPEISRVFPLTRLKKKIPKIYTLIIMNMSQGEILQNMTSCTN